MEISFHIPNSNTQFVGDENRPSAQVCSFLTSINLLNAENTFPTFKFSNLFALGGCHS